MLPMATSVTDRRERALRFIPPSPTSAYHVRMAATDEDVRRAQELRFQVFNRELGEGLSESEDSGRDADVFDSVCDHLLVEHVNTSEIIGTYRLQTGRVAAERIGYYSEQEFEFGAFEPLRAEIVELGRACIAKDHRNMVTLGLLWKGIAQYAKLHDARYLLGCSSLTSTDPLMGVAAYRTLAGCLAEPAFRTVPKPDYACLAEADEAQIAAAARSVEIPRLMRAYLTLGARICGEPALDRAFKTIDFLTLLDFRSLGPRAMQKFLG